MKKVTVLGEGAWGSALATLLAHNNNEVTLWCHNEGATETIRKQHIIPTIDLKTALSHQIIFVAIPVKFLREFFVRIKPYLRHDHLLVITSKGIETTTLFVPTQIFDDVVQQPVTTVVLSGPNYAHDLMRQQPTATVLASTNSRACQTIASFVENEFFKTTVSSDILGVQLCAAIKNVLALGIGILQGAGYTDNCQGWALTQGFHELALIVTSLQGSFNTILGLAGFGDLVITCMGKHSRNRMLGEQIGKGMVAMSQQESSSPEGLNTIISLKQIIQQHNIKAPFIEALYDVIVNAQPVDYLVTTLAQHIH